MKRALNIFCFGFLLAIATAYSGPGAGAATGTPDQIRHSIRTLKSRNSAAARAGLLEMALTPGIRDDLALYAASAYCSQLTNRRDAALLLTSGNLEIRDLALARMIGCNFDHQIWEQLKSVLASGTALQRGLVADIVQYDRATVPANEKASALVEGFQWLEKAEGAQRMVVFGEWDMHHTVSEVSHWQLCRCLMMMGGLEPDVLSTLAESTSGKLRECVLIARGYRGDTTVKDDLRRIVLHNPNALIRSLGITAIMQRGTGDDLPALRQVEQKDPAVIKNYIPHLIRSTNDLSGRTFYPLRERAAEVIKRMSVK